VTIFMDRKRETPDSQEGGIRKTDRVTSQAGVTHSVSCLNYPSIENVSFTGFAFGHGSCACWSRVTDAGRPETRCDRFPYAGR